MKMRRMDRLVSDPARIGQIIADSAVCRMAVKDEEGLYIVPLSFGYVYEGDSLTLYFHSAKEGRKIRAVGSGCEAAFEMDSMSRVTEGPIPCNYSCLYSSITGAGRASMVEDIEEKKLALSLITEHTAGRRFEFTDAQASAVAIIKLSADTFSAKEKAQ